MTKYRIDGKVLIIFLGSEEMDFAVKHDWKIISIIEKLELPMDLEIKKIVLEYAT